MGRISTAQFAWDLFSSMKQFSRIIWVIFLVASAFSCSDDGGSIATDDDMSFKNSLAAFNEFLKINDSRFIHTSGGLHFSDIDLCTALNEIYIDGAYYDLKTSGCFFPSNPVGPSSFFIANSIDRFGGENLAFVSVQFRYSSQIQNSEPPPSGTYYVAYDCSWACIPNITIDIYTVDSQGDLYSRFGGITDKVVVTNEGGVVSVQFDATFYPWVTGESFQASAKVACCR